MKKTLHKFIEKYLNDTMYFEVNEQDNMYKINFINCCNWPAISHLERLKKIKQLEKRLNELNLSFSINKTA